jgi:hypothetical protein
MCFPCMLLVCEMYELWMNKFCIISITKSWDAKFVIWIGSGTNMLQHEMFYQMFDNIINEMSPFISDQCQWIFKLSEDAVINEYDCYCSCVHL